MTAEYTRGFALVGQDGLPIASTVSATERAVMANALVNMYGHMVYAGHSTAKIKEDFERLEPKGHKIIPVEIWPSQGDRDKHAREAREQERAHQGR